MSYKKIVIEDSIGRKYYPITSVKNIPDIEKVSEYINIDNIKIDSSTSEKLGDTIINIKNDLKDHKHSTDDITTVGSKQFVTTSEKNGAKGIRANSTDTYTVSTPNSRVLIGSSSSRATGENSTIIASETSKTSQARSAVIASKNSETDGATYSNRSGNVILASYGVKTPSGSRNLVVGGCASDTGAPPSTDNIKWKLDSVEGTLWVDRDVEIGDMKVKKEIDKKADKEIRDSKTNKKYYLDIYDNRVFLREVK